MEAAALFAVAAVRGVAIASAFCISGLLRRHEWHPDFNSPKLLEGVLALADGAGTALQARGSFGGPHHQASEAPPIVGCATFPLVVRATWGVDRPAPEVRVRNCPCLGAYFCKHLTRKVRL